MCLYCPLLVQCQQCTEFQLYIIVHTLHHVTCFEGDMLVPPWPNGTFLKNSLPSIKKFVFVSNFVKATET